MSAHLLKEIIEKNKAGQRAGLYCVCSANELVLRAAARHAARNCYPLVIESTANQVNQFGGYTGIQPHEFVDRVRNIAEEEKLPPDSLVLGGDHLGPLLWQHENSGPAMEKAVEMVRAYTLSGYGKIHLDTSMKLHDDPEGPLDIRVCARRCAMLAKAVYESFEGIKDNSRRPVLVIGSEVPIPGGSKEHEHELGPTDSGDFLRQVEVFKEEFQKEGIDFNDVIAFVVQPGVEFGDDHVFFYDPEKARPLTRALKTVPHLVFEGHSTDYQGPHNLANLVRDGIAILKVGPGLSFALREALLLLEAVEQTIIPQGQSDFKKALLDEMAASKKYWENYYSGTPGEIEYKKLYSYSDRCRYYLPAETVQKALATLLNNISVIPQALLSQYFPTQYSRYMQGKLQNDPISILCDRIGDTCADYARACGFSIS